MAIPMSDLDEVSQLMQHYVDGADGDVALLRRIFHPSARMIGQWAGHEVEVPIDDFYAEVEANPGMAGPDYQATVRSIDLTGDVGVAVLVETDYFGCDFVDYFTVARIEGTWRITQKSYAVTGGPTAEGG